MYVCYLKLIMLEDVIGGKIFIDEILPHILWA